MHRIGVFLVVSLLVTAGAVPARAASIVTEWLDDVLPAANEVASEPTVGARFFAIVQTAMYDAWSAYDPAAVAVVLGPALKNQGGLATEANKREAISHAAYTVLRTLAPQRRRALAERMAALGYDPDASTPPAELGRRAALAVLAKFHQDGADEADDFADTTGYMPRSAHIADAWQPIELFGKRQLPTTPQWQRVMPFALAGADQFRPAPPPAPGSPEWTRQIDNLIETSAALTDGQKAAAEFWAEWGSSPAPHLIELTKYVSDRNDLRIDDDVKLFFAVANAMLDASIASWDAKYAYDYVRPITAIHVLGDTVITAWKPRSLPEVLAYSTPEAAAAADGAVAHPAGIGAVAAADWEPYLPTPAFPSYVSGHSTFCAAWARVMELAIGKPDFDFRTTMHHLYVEDRQLARPVTLDYPTFSFAAAACGMSRIWGGIHWPADNESGLELGRKVGEAVWQRYQQFAMGIASPATAAFAAMRPPFWFHTSETADHPAGFAYGSGLAIDVRPGTAGTWQSKVLDAMPRGAYELKLRASSVGEAPVQLRVAIAPNGEKQTGAIGTAAALVPATGASSDVMIAWVSDGSRPVTIAITVRATGGGARLTVSAMTARRIWPVVAGTRRYYEPSLVGRVGH